MYGICFHKGCESIEQSKAQTDKGNREIRFMYRIVRRCVSRCA